METETKTCQNCHQNFTIDSDDFSFYEKMKVPPPTFCPECRMIRRMLYRNERTLYKKDCDLCKKSTISMYDPASDYVVYCTDCYASDNWDPLNYGRDYDFTKPFFVQLGELFKTVPRRTLYQDFAVNSEYTNQCVYIKDCYLCFGGHHYEDSAYCAQDFYLKNCLDVDFSHKSEFCLESIHIANCFRVRFGYYSENCMDSWFIYGCRNCSDCIGCTNLINKNFCIFNEQYAKEEYQEKVKAMNFSDADNLVEISKAFWEHSLKFPRKYANIKNIINSTGDDLDHVTNCNYVFSVGEAENVKYSFYSSSGAKDCFDIDHVALSTSEGYEHHSGFGDNKVFFSSRIYFSYNVEYSDDVYNSNNIFACASLKKKAYCIFNKEYSESEYETLKEKIIKHMDEMPYVDNGGVIYKYGEFFPKEIVPFSYNESVVFEYFPLTKEEILEKGYRYKEPELKNYKPTILAHQLPSINDADENVLKEIIQCEHVGHCNHKCTMAFRIIQNELNIHKMLGVALPKLCPNCRHMERMNLLKPPRLYDRKCMHEGCENKFETPYAADRPEIIYCEKCYQQEVI